MRPMYNTHDIDINICSLIIIFLIRLPFEHQNFHASGLTHLPCCNAKGSQARASKVGYVSVSLDWR